MAGWAVAEGIRAREPDRPIRMLATDSGDYYIKPQLSNGFAKGLDAQSMVRESAVERAARLGVDLLPHLRALEYGETMKELIHEKFGDGIMSAIDFTMDIEKVPDPKGDRVKVTWNGKFLPYKSW